MPAFLTAEQVVVIGAWLLLSGITNGPVIVSEVMSSGAFPG